MNKNELITTIDINNFNTHNLTEEEKEDLLKLINKMNSTKWWQSTEFDISPGKPYYTISPQGDVIDEVILPLEKEEYETWD